MSEHEKEALNVLETLAYELVRDRLLETAIHVRRILWIERGGLQILSPNQADHFAKAIKGLDDFILNLRVDRDYS